MSGLNHTLAKGAIPKGIHEFKSHRLRHYLIFKSKSYEEIHGSFFLDLKKMVIQSQRHNVK